ncbi:Biotin/lipoyl attachment [Trinorchestia longiramus]|nr:Biotin/lipoyl attachment [Trinorchestia longiramus]
MDFFRNFDSGPVTVGPSGLPSPSKMNVFKKFARYSNISRLRSSIILNERLSRRLIHISCSANGEGIAIKMPSLSPTMMEGKIVKWFKQEGDPVEPGDVLCDIETDKAVVSLETEEEGTLAKILVDPTADTIKIGTLIAVLAPEGEDWKAVEIPADSDAPAAVAAPAAGTASSAAAGPAGGAPTSDKRKYGPSVRLLLQEYSLRAEELVGSGPHGELLKGDVLKHIQLGGLKKVQQKAVAAPKAAPATATAKSASKASAGPSSASYTDVDASNMRRAIAKRLLQSKSGTAHSYATLECRLDEVLALRKKFKKDGIVFSVNDFMVKAVATSLLSHPALNQVWRGGQAVVSPSIDISVAVATSSGLITPIVRDADRLGIKDISNTIRELAARAKINKLKPEEFEGGSFSISNLGMLGIREFTAVINPPQCAILAVGGSTAVLGEDGTPETRMRATLSYDRLVVDDFEAADFLSTLVQLLEQPMQVLLGRRDVQARQNLS